MSGTIIILAAIAAFLGYRLYSILGKRTGHEQEPMLPRKDVRVESSTVPPMTQPRSDALEAMTGAASRPQALVYEPRAEAGISMILTKDRNFSVGRFLEGAQSAYKLILEAYWQGDKDMLKTLCDDDSYVAFAEAIDAREARGEVLDNRLVTIENAIISDADLFNGLARITVRFDSDIAAVTRDKDGNVIAGSLSDAVETHDVWTFSRHISSNDPNWKLDETDEA